MRIISSCDTFFGDFPGGLARVAWDVAKALARRGHEVAMIAGTSDSVQSGSVTLTESMIDGVRVYRYPKPAMSRLDPLRASKQIRYAATALADVMTRRKWDAIHCHSIFTAAAALKAAPNVPRLQTVHSPAIQELPYNWSQQGLVGQLTVWAGRSVVRGLEARAVDTASRCHALSRFTVEQMQAEYPAGQQQYTVIPHWADRGWCRTISRDEARRLLSWPTDVPILFTVRQLRYRYGIDTAIRAVAPLAAAGRCRFFIGGAGEESAALQQLIDGHEAHATVQLMGRISDEQLRLAYQAADLFVLPTRALECFGLIILEALACGLPVVGTDVGAIPENLIPILPNCIVPRDDPESLRCKIDDLLSGRLRLPQAENLTAYVAREFGEQKVIDSYEAIFSELIAT